MIPQFHFEDSFSSSSGRSTRSDQVVVERRRRVRGRHKPALQRECFQLHSFAVLSNTSTMTIPSIPPLIVVIVAGTADVEDIPRADRPLR